MQQHTHHFTATPAFMGGTGRPQLSKYLAVPEEVLEIVGAMTATDEDTCDSQVGMCSLQPYGRKTQDWTHRTAFWEDSTDPGRGYLGHLVGGSFVAGEPYSHYKLPAKPCVVHVLQKWIDEGRPFEGVNMVVDGEVTFSSNPITVWDILVPTRDPIEKWVMPTGVPAVLTKGVSASEPVSWSTMSPPGQEIFFSLQSQQAPQTSNELMITTANNRPNDPPNNGRLPSSNSVWGPKTITASEPVGGSMLQRQYRLFYNKETDLFQNLWADHTYGDGPCPNWYFYYCQTAANYDGLYGAANYNHFLEQEVAPGFAAGTWWDGSAWLIHFGPGAASSGYPLWGDGIDFFANLCRHQWQHLVHYSGQYDGWWPAGRETYPLLPIAADTDADMIPDNLEKREGGIAPDAPYYNWEDMDTYDRPDGWPAGWNDDEHYAKHRQDAWVLHSADQYDWAAPGHQS